MLKPELLTLIFREQMNYLMGGKMTKNLVLQRGLKKIVGDQRVDMISGGPPCQAYSLAGRVRDKNGMKDDYRNFLLNLILR